MAQIFKAKTLVANSGKFAYEVSAPNLVSNTGNQNIGGNKNFYTRPTVNGTGVLLSGEAVNLPATIVYITGDQNISGVKNFYSRPTVNGTGVLLIGEASSATLPDTIVYTTGNQKISGDKNFVENVIFGDQTQDDLLLISGNKITFGVYPTVNGTGIVYTQGDQTISGIKTFTSRPTVNGTGVLLIGEASAITLPTTIVYTTGNQLISGNKTFLKNIAVSGTGDFNSVKVSNIDKLFLSGIDIVITGNSSINVYNAIYISGNQVLTGVMPSSQTLTNVVFTTGNQVISGNKTFLNNVNISGTGSFNAVKVSSIDKLFLSGIDVVVTGNSSINVYNAIYISGNPVLTGIIPTSQTITNVVYTTGDQLISGNKTFLNNINVSGTGNFNNVRVSSIDKLFLSGVDIVITGNSSINVYNAIYISGNPVLTGAIPTNQNITNVVYTTGDQIISGVKTFANTGSFDTLQITNKKLSSYNYVDSNFTFGNAYINIANSSNNIIGTLPSEITSGINYYIKNLNIGILLITGSGQRTIDGFSTVNLYNNESLQLLGVNNIGYTGWITVGEGIGVS